MYNYNLTEAQENYPEIVNPLLNKINSLETQVGSMTAVTQRFQAEQHRAAIEARYPDAYKLAASDDFAVWKCNQAPIIQQALDQGTAQDVISALDLYHNSNNQGQTRTFTNAQIASMTQQEFNQHEAEIDAALARGEIW